jgi:hypothetical protein
MPQPISEAVFDGTCFELRPGAGAVDVVLATAASQRVVEIARENAQIGRLQTLDRRRFFGTARVAEGASAKIELSGSEPGQAVVRCERR